MNTNDELTHQREGEKKRAPDYLFQLRLMEDNTVMRTANLLTVCTVCVCVCVCLECVHVCKCMFREFGHVSGCVCVCVCVCVRVRVRVCV